MLDAFAQQITQKVEQLLQAACEGPGWLDVLRRCGLDLAPAVARKGPAPVEEVRQVLQALVQEATATLDGLAAGPGLDPGQVAGIRHRLERLAEHEAQRYAAALAKMPDAPPKKSSGIAAIFNNAVETYKLSPWADLVYDRRVIVTCRTCGAPQLQRRNFQCEFCGGDMFSRQEG